MHKIILFLLSICFIGCTENQYYPETKLLQINYKQNNEDHYIFLNVKKVSEDSYVVLSQEGIKEYPDFIITEIFDYYGSTSYWDSNSTNKRGR